ncbi:hybrid sensor histidine kinase/response regulator [Aestuariivivens insulae]|uniref:hybrid sensor histidine kinase/response regulator n=1 Tax=Aestuariivivens insulae TaxID=1621988 RepID=UPI001F5ABCE0|nr:hybrid sensor histidine kinase/response regulator [Aestuariivivens insulae]
MKFQHSIVIRLALFFTGLIIFSILLSGYLVFEKSSKVITEYAKNRIIHESELAEQAFYALLNEVSNDIAVIASSPTLNNYALDPSRKSTKDINSLFQSILSNKASYFQIRFIGAENNGKEIIRFDKKDGVVFQSDDLQEKGNRDYFKEAIHIKKGELYFSKINLNEEYGIISKPYTPTLRAASPIFNTNNKAIGIVIINVDLTRLYNTLDKISKGESQLYLLDKAGEYLYALDKDKLFASQTGNDYNFYSDFKINPNTSFTPKQVETGTSVNLNNNLLSYAKLLSYFKGKRNLYLIAAVKQNILLQSAHAVRANSLQALLLVCLICILLSWFFVSIISKKINQITKAISNYDEGMTSDIPLPVNRNDEIGVLARTFKKMKAKIDQNVNKLNIALEKEKQAKQQRDEFLQNMSHELRTPLNAILGLTQLLKKNTQSNAQLPIIEALDRSANNLAGLVYDVLDHKKIVEGTLHIEYKPTNIAHLLQDIYSSYQYEAIRKGLDFNIEIDKTLEKRRFQIDPLRLSQMVTNLVVNALKFTTEGKVKLQARISPNNPEQLEIKVIDTGIGILPENINKINNRYFQESKELSGRYGGYGLGLSIVKQLSSLFGGYLSVESQKGIGSTFCVTIPIVPTNDTKVKEEQSIKTQDVPELKKRYKILHMEDDMSTMELIKHIFTHKSIELYQVSSVSEASNYLSANKPDLVFSDLLLNDVHLEAQLNQWVQSKQITCPLVLVSASEPEVMQTITPIYVQKPFQIDELKDYTFKILGAHEFSQPNFSNLYHNYDHDKEKIARVIDLLIDEFETYKDRIERAVTHKDQKEWDAILHKLITHINNLGLNSLLESLPEKVEALTLSQLQDVLNTFNYYLCCFRVERRINLKD